MVYNTGNHWIFGLCPSSRILVTRHTMFRELDLFPSSGEGREAPAKFAKFGLSHYRKYID
jgi:hypothetical protein